MAVTMISLAIVLGTLLAGTTTSDAAVSPMARANHSDTLLELKFNDDSGIVTQGNKFKGTGAEEVNNILGKVKIDKNEPLFSEDKANLKKMRSELKAQKARLKEMRSELKAQNEEVPDLTQWHILKLGAGADINEIARLLEAHPAVQYAYPQPLPAPSPSTPNYQDSQFHRGLAPRGINSNDAATWPGAKGGNVKIADLEYSWNVDHEDLSKARAAGAVLANGTPHDPHGNTNHGTMVIGMLSSDANTFGTTGMVPDAKLRLVNTSTTTGYFPANAINVARTNLAAGDVILIEQQANGPGDAAADYVPLEWIPSVYDAIRLATEANITVVEPAGNGNQDLDDTAKFGSVFPSGKADSGAIIVGAARVCESAGPSLWNSRASFSTYGSRVNMHGGGECIVTTGRGNLYNSSPNAMYTNTFAGTSAASPQVAAAAASFSSAYKQLNGVAPNASLVRSTLAANGTPQNLGAGTLPGNIGPMPDLSKALLKTDLTAPSVPGSFNVTIDATSRKPKLTWTASTDNVGVAGYRIYRNGSLLTTIAPNTTYIDSTATSGFKAYTISAIDKSGHASAQTEYKIVTVP